MVHHATCDCDPRYNRFFVSALPILLLLFFFFKLSNILILTTSKYIGILFALFLTNQRQLYYFKTQTNYINFWLNSTFGSIYLVLYILKVSIYPLRLFLFSFWLFPQVLSHVANDLHTFKSIKYSKTTISTRFSLRYKEILKVFQSKFAE
jgi:hypothetical protein